MRILFTTIPRITAVLSGDTIGHRVLLWLRLMYFAISRKFYARGKSMAFTFSYEKNEFTLFLSYVTDLAVLYEVFYLKEYEWGLRSAPKVIVDLGAHWGDTSVYYHLMYPEAMIYAVEPAPGTYSQLRKNVAHIPHIIPVQAAVSDRTGTAELNISPSSFGSSLHKRSDTQEVVGVPVYTIQDLFLKLGIDRADLIKFDIEGAEEKLFVTGTPSEFADAYIGEVHEDLISIDFKEFESKFNGFFVEKIGLTNPHRFVMRAVRNTQ
jgi:FkbM family methyltransferase